jgi:anti-sigma regulatory factor (Ser/Thr protein kinase)
MSRWWGAVALEESFIAGTLPELRKAVLAEAVAAGLADDRARDVALAVHELAANAVRHGGGAGRLWMLTGGGALYCRVSDDGPGGDSDARAPDAMTVWPWPVQPGHGLWLVSTIADHLNIVPGVVGSEVALMFALPVASGGQGGQLLPA